MIAANFCQQCRPRDAEMERRLALVTASEVQYGGDVARLGRIEAFGTRSGGSVGNYEIR